MGLLFILIGYFLDFKNDKNTFFKDISIGITYFFINALFFGVLHLFFGLGLLFCIFGFGIEIILVFALKAYIQSR